MTAARSACDCVISWCLVAIDRMLFCCAFQVKLVQHVYSCLFGEFLCNTERDRSAQRVRQLTTSVWTLLSRQNIRFVNVLYQPTSMLLRVCAYNIHRVPKKTKQICFCQNCVKFPPILIIFGRKMANDPNICEVYSFSTSPNLRHHLTVLNANVPNCYITLNVVICNKL